MTWKQFWDAWRSADQRRGHHRGARSCVRIVLHFVIRRVVNQIVTGAKKRQRVDDTQALAASPLSAVRIVQRTRTLGSGC